MTREEAVAILTEDMEFIYGGDEPYSKQAYDMAIEALSAEAEDKHYIRIYADDDPSVKAEKLYQICGETQNREVTEWLKEYFPSAEAVQGEWIMHGEPPWYVRECSECGTKWHQWSGYSNPNYCGHCGARMKGGDSE